MNKILDQFLAKEVDNMIKEFQKNNVYSNQQAKATFTFLTDLASGKTKTTAKRIRQMVRTSPHYKFDSVLSEVAHF